MSNFESFKDYDMDVLFHVGDYASGGLAILIQRIERFDDGEAITNFDPFSWTPLTINLHDDSIFEDEQYLDDYVEDAFCEDIEKLGYFSRTDKKKEYQGRVYTLVKWNLDKFKRAEEKEPKSIYQELYYRMLKNYNDERDCFLRSGDCAFVFKNAYRINFFEKMLSYYRSFENIGDIIPKEKAETILKKYNDKVLTAIFSYCRECFGLADSESFYKEALKAFCNDIDNKEVLELFENKAFAMPISDGVEPIFERTETRDFYSV